MMSSPHQVHLNCCISGFFFFFPFTLIHVNEKNPEKLKRKSPSTPEIPCP